MNKDFLYLVLIAVSWLLFYGMVLGLVWFGATARYEGDRCVAAYQDYLDECISNCTIKLVKENGSGKVFNITYSGLVKN